MYIRTKLGRTHFGNSSPVPAAPDPSIRSGIVSHTRTSRRRRPSLTAFHVRYFVCTYIRMYCTHVIHECTHYIHPLNAPTYASTSYADLPGSARRRWQVARPQTALRWQTEWASDLAGVTFEIPPVSLARDWTCRSSHAPSSTARQRLEAFCFLLRVPSPSTSGYLIHVRLEYKLQLRRPLLLLLWRFNSPFH